MTREEITKLDGKVIDRKLLEEMKECEQVKVIRDNGMDAKRIGKRWYVVVFKDGYGINVYAKNGIR